MKKATTYHNSHTFSSRLLYVALSIAMASFFSGCPGGGDDQVEVQKNPSCVFGQSDLDCIALEEFQPEGESNDLECQENEQGVNQVCGDIISIEFIIGQADNPLGDFLARGRRVPARYVNGAYYPIISDYDEIL